MSLATGTNLTFTVIAMYVGTILVETIKGWTFVLCAGFSLLAGFFFLFGLKETFGLTEKQISVLYCDKDAIPFHDEDEVSNKDEKVITNLDDSNN